MARAYRGYRGKRSGGCLIPLLIVLCVVAAAVSLFLHRNLVYTPEGTEIRIPFSDKTFSLSKDEEPFDENVDLIIEEPVEEIPSAELPAEPIISYEARLEQSVFLPIDALLRGGLDGLLERISGTEINTVVLEVKADDGRLAFAAQNDLAQRAKASAASNDAVKAALAKLEERGLNACAQISCFRDNLSPRAQRTGGIPLNNGLIFIDNDEYTWLDAYDAEGREYLKALIGEVYDLGFKEILLTNLSFPTQGGLLPAIRYEGSDKAAAIGAFIADAKAVADAKGGKLAAVYENHGATQAEQYPGGQVLSVFCESFYRIYSRVDEAGATAVSDAMAQALGEDLKTRFVPCVTVEDAAAAKALAAAAKAQGNGCMYIRSDGVYPDGIFEKSPAVGE